MTAISAFNFRIGYDNLRATGGLIGVNPCATNTAGCFAGKIQRIAAGNLRSVFNIERAGKGVRYVNGIGGIVPIAGPTSDSTAVNCNRGRAAEFDCFSALDIETAFIGTVVFGIRLTGTPCNSRLFNLNCTGRITISIDGTRRLIGS